MSIKVSFKVNSLRKVPCPFGRDRDSENPQITYFAICNVRDLPDNIPMDTNPREQNLNTKVAHKIQDSLLNDTDTNFHLLNRGLVISADTVKFNNETNMLTMTFTDLEKHGNVDGGHTYKILLANRNKLDSPQYVRLEIMTGIEDIFEDLAGARNTSVQVQDKSLAELEGKFDIIKNALHKEPFFNSVAFKENADGDIDITDIIAILTMFNIERFNETNHPVIAYSSKKKCIDNFLLDVQLEDNAFKRMTNIAPDIFKLYSYIEQRMPQVYNDKDGGGKYGRVKGVIFKDNKPFYRQLFEEDKYICYESPKGFIYPILAAFRVLVKHNTNTGYYEWDKNADIFKYFDYVDKELVITTIERSRTLGNNPQSVGKDSGHWAQMYRILQTKYYEKVIKQLMK